MNRHDMNLFPTYIFLQLLYNFRRLIFYFSEAEASSDHWKKQHIKRKIEQLNISGWPLIFLETQQSHQSFILQPEREKLEAEERITAYFPLWQKGENEKFLACVFDWENENEFWISDAYQNICKLFFWPVLKDDLDAATTLSIEFCA